MTASDDRAPNPIERVVELAVFAPVGLALTAREELPALVDKGRQQLSSQLTVARMVGELALSRGQKMADNWVTTTLDRLSGSRSDTEGPGPGSDGGPDTDTPIADRPAPANPTTRPGPEFARPIDGDVRDLDASRLRARTPDAAGLPIPGYDSLSASQVVQRLPGLTADELDAVRAYEQAGRGRKTILVRVAQLRAVS